jgi:hypothetical protein
MVLERLKQKFPDAVLCSQTIRKTPFCSSRQSPLLSLPDRQILLHYIADLNFCCHTILPWQTVKNTERSQLFMETPALVCSDLLIVGNHCSKECSLI